MSFVSFYTAAAALLLAHSVCGLQPSFGKLRAHQHSAKVPKWACPLTAMEEKAAKMVYAMLPKPLRQIQASGNATRDAQTGEIIRQAAERMEAEDEAEARNFVDYAKADAKGAKRFAEMAAELDKQVKAEETAKNMTGAQHDSADAVATAQAAIDESKKAKFLAGDAMAFHRVGEIEGQAMAQAAEDWEKTANAEQRQVVPGVTVPELRHLMATENILVVFYAPWCPHCQDYVLHDVEHNFQNAPIELLNKELIKVGGPRVVKFDVTAHQPPAGFNVEYVPTLYKSSKGGPQVKFDGDKLSAHAIKNFVLGKQKSIA